MFKFIVGEYVQQRDDGVLATVLTCEETHNYPTLYRVEVEGALGYEKYVFATEHSWMPYVPHAHITHRSRDCDGVYEHDLVVMPTDEERCNIYGDMEFKRRMISEAISISGFGGTLDLEGDTFSWYEKTEEGYVQVSGQWCYDCGETDKSYSFRDFTAEAAGY